MVDDVVVAGVVRDVIVGVVAFSREVIDGLLEEGWIVVGNPVMKMVGRIERLPEVKDAACGTRSAASDVAGDVGEIHVVRER